jgi:hypothetical protein
MVVPDRRTLTQVPRSPDFSRYGTRPGRRGKARVERILERKSCSDFKAIVYGSGGVDCVVDRAEYRFLRGGESDVGFQELEL